MDKQAKELIEKLLAGELYQESTHEKYNPQGELLSRTVSRHSVAIPPKVLEQLFERVVAPKQAEPQKTWEVRVVEVPYLEQQEDG